MKIRRTITVGIGAAMAVAIAAAGAASASTEPARSQTFVLYSARSSFEGENTVIAVGPISGVGRERVVEDRSTETTVDFTGEYVFPGGTVTVEVRGQSATTADFTACAGSVTGTVSWTITGGTGAYAGASGSGAGTFTDRFVVERGPSGCLQNDAVVNVFVARFDGWATLAGTQAA